MNNILIIISVVFFIAAIVVNIFTNNTWKSVGISWGLLSLGAILFGIGLTIS